MMVQPRLKGKRSPESVHVPKTYESITRYYGRYSCRRRGERAKLATPDEEQESDYRREFRRSS